MGGQEINRGGAKTKIGGALPPLPPRWRRAWFTGIMQKCGYFITILLCITRFFDFKIWPIVLIVLLMPSMPLFAICFQILSKSDPHVLKIFLGKKIVSDAKSNSSVGGGSCWWSKDCRALVQFPNWQCVVVSLGKTLSAYFPFGPTSLPVVVTQSNKRLANRTPKKVPCFGVVRQTHSVYFIRTKNDSSPRFIARFLWELRGQQLEIKPPPRFHHLYHFVWAKSQSILQRSLM